MRTDLSGDPSLRELVARVRETCLGAYDHQELPFEKLVEELRPERDLRQNPLFQVMFTLQNALAERPAPEGLQALPFALEAKTARFDLELHAQEWPGQLALALAYRTDLFEPGTARRMLAQYVRLLEGALAEPQARFGELALLSAEEERRVLVEWNATARHDPREATVVELFREQARRTPAALALDGRSRTLTYLELDESSRRVARRLLRLGVGAETVVGLLTERSPEMVVGALGILKAGAAYLPLDPDDPADRLSLTLADSRVEILLTEDRLVGRLPPGPWRVISLDRPWEGVPDSEAEPPSCDPGAQGLAYVIYTSGSTGKPKGVELAHGGLSNLARWHQRVFDVRPGDRATQVASPAFDASVWEIWPYLVSGASIHFPDEETRSSPERLIAWLGERRITHSFLPTPLAEAVLEEPAVAALGLRWLLTGGDKLHRRERSLPFHLVNNYGPTEATVVATCTEVAPGGDKDPPIGRPIDNTRAYVLDERHAARARGRAGRALRRRSRAGPWLPRPTRAHRRALLADPFAPSRAAGCTGPATGCAAGRRQPRVPRTPGPPGQAARVPHRAG